MGKGRMMDMDDGGLDQRLLLCLLSGFIFAGGWVLWVDGYVIANRSNPVMPHTTTPSPLMTPTPKDDLYVSYKFKDWTPGLVGMLAFVLMNMMAPKDLSNEDSMLDERDLTLNRAWFFFSVIIMFVSLTLAIIFHLNPYSHKNGYPSYPGIAMLLQSILIGVSSFIFFFARGKKV